ncbi:MAG: beta galactosidase jelly roll domain-containing protein [Alistipes sp.]|jgi:sialate O-acetylesterase|nr:beta galactosidase jelly roll domain-containing protein [Alistipes sp.]
MKQLFKVAFCLAVTLAATIFTSEARVTLPRLVSDGMVLQRDTPLKVWGWADTGETVKLTFQNKTYSTRTGRGGEWSISLPALSPGGPYTLTVAGNRSGGEEIVLHDVMVGDVWMCSGQSNMETFVYRVMDLYADEIRAFNYPNIRYFRVQTRTAFGRQEADVAGEWVPAVADRISNLSVLALFFAREMYEHNGVPVGLIHNAVGGTPIEAWMSPEYMQKYPAPWAQVEMFSRPGYLDSLNAAAANAAPRPRLNPMNDNDPGVGRWFRPDIDDSDWGTMSLPGYWSEKGLERVPGTMWFRREVTLTAEQAVARNATLRMGTIVDSDSTWVNGTFVGNITYQYPPRVYPVPAGVLREGRNVIATRVTSNSGNGGFVEQKPYKLFVGRDPWGQQIDRIGDPAPAGPGWEIDLSGDWKYRVGAQIPRTTGGAGTGAGRGNFAPRPSNNSPTGLYNGVVAPVRNYALRGFLWYQGESNAGRAAEYRNMMADLIEGWRREWNDPQKPFLYVQLPNMLDGNGWAEMRDVQRQTLRIPATGMATTLGAGEWNDIHPMNKKDVAHRLALEARRVVFGEQGVGGTGPLFESMRVEDGAAIVEFLCVGADIYPNVRLGGFEIAGADGNYRPARAVVLRGNTVKVWNPAVTAPVRVRYAWAGDPVEANLRDRDGIPASTFEALAN